MIKRLTLVLAIAFVAAFALSAYAAVQNVKVSGDILISAVERNNFTLTNGNANFPIGEYGTKYKVGGFMSQARLRIDADLTDNVTATIRFINERPWGEAMVAGSDTNAIDLDLAYVKLKEFLYSPLTLTIGRQEIRFGNGFIIGSRTSNFLNEYNGVPFDLSLQKSFDAARATLNYDPMVIDLIYAKIREDGTTPIPFAPGAANYWWQDTGTPDKIDVDLYGLNARYDLNGLGFKGAVEGYYFGRFNDAPIQAGVGSIKRKPDACNTIGGLVYGELMKDSTGVLSGSFESAYQFGRFQQPTTNPDTAAAAGILPGPNANLRRSAWAMQAALNYDINMRMKPTVGLIYTFFSGDKTNRPGNRMGFWDPMFKDQVLNSIPNALFPATDCHIINVKGSLKPMEDITLSGVYGWYRLVDPVTAWTLDNDLPSPYGSDIAGGEMVYHMTGKHFLGNAVDATITYDYTEDVQFALTGGLFMPGKAFASENRNTASQVIGSMKVTF